jgi:hypothetical protein
MRKALLVFAKTFEADKSLALGAKKFLYSGTFIARSYLIAFQHWFPCMSFDPDQFELFGGVAGCDNLPHLQGLEWLLGYIQPVA